MPVGAVLANDLLFVLQIIFVLPTAYPITEQTLNYAPVAVGTVLVGTLVVWFLPFGWGARSWFKGELHNLTSESSVCASHRPIQYLTKENTIYAPQTPRLACYLPAADARAADSRAICTTSPVRVWSVHPKL